MAYSYLDTDCDSTFGEDAFFWSDPMFSHLSPPLAGTKREAHHLVDDPAAGHLDHIDPQVLCCSTCCPGQPDSRPSKRRASALEVGELHSDAATLNASSNSTSNPNTIPNPEHPFPDICFEKFCQDCDLDTSCSFSCSVSCAGDAECDQDDVCQDPRCDQVPQCADSCVDPECTKLSCPTDPCFCQKCDAQPCPLGDPANDCHLAHSAPTSSGTIYCYDNAPCHFQQGGHATHGDLPPFEGYQCFSQAHGPLGQGGVAGRPSSSATPMLSPSNYTSLESHFSGQSSPVPGLAAGVNCFLNIPDDHCHIDNSCCHGPRRACGDMPSVQEDHFDLWKLSLGHGDGPKNINDYSFYGMPTSQPMGSLSLDAPSLSSLNMGHADALGMDSLSWMMPDSQFSTPFPMPDHASGNKLDFLATAVQGEAEQLQNGLEQIRPDTSASNESSSACVCKWRHGPNYICNQSFDSPEALHKHIKLSHVDSCTRCFCQWEGCEACNKDFKQRSKLSRHLLGHAGYRPYACSFEGCNKTFATNQAKDNHERTHTGDRPYVCDRCGYTTTTHTQLQTHISALHLNQKPHKCRFCDFTCADSSNLSKHERTHQTLRPYRCPHPGCTFKPDCRWENLKRHLRRSGHCPELLAEGSEEYKAYREGVRREIDEWHRRSEGAEQGKGGVKGGRRKGRV